MTDKPRQLAIISGKGGTGKTSVTAALAAMAREVVLADCDVDAPNLHLVLAPRHRLAEVFCGSKRAIIDAQRCAACGRCAMACRFDAISLSGSRNGAVDATYRVDELACEGCGVCALVCPTSAITLADAINGQLFVSDTRLGPMVHARLSPGHENSGKLVSLVRTQARRVAEQAQASWILIDGAPGIGCPVIASISGVDQVLVVTEPSKSGLHDLERALDLSDHFGIPAAVCVNKWDIEPDLTKDIETVAVKRGATLAGRVRYDRAVVEAQSRGLSVVEFSSNGVSADMRQIWEHVHRVATPALPEENS